MFLFVYTVLVMLQELAANWGSLLQVFIIPHLSQIYLPLLKTLQMEQEAYKEFSEPKRDKTYKLGHHEWIA